MQCKYDKQFSGLIIEGKPSKEELKEAFETIETEFNDLCGVFPDELKKTNKVNALIARNKAVELCFFAIDECLRRANVPCLDALPRLKKHGVNIVWKEDIEDYKKQVQSAKTRNITKEVELEELTKEIENLHKQTVKSPEFTKKNFYQLIVSVEAVLGVKVPETETNMYKFGVLCSDYYELVKRQKAS